MENIFLNVKESDLSKNELAAYRKLVEFYYVDNYSCDVDDISFKICVLGEKLNPHFGMFLAKKIDLIKRENDVNLVYKFLFSDFKNYSDFVKKMEMSPSEFRKLINSRIENITGSVEIGNEFLEKLKYWVKQEETYRRGKLKLYDDFLYVFLNSRYHASNIKTLTSVSPMEFIRGIEKDNMLENYPIDISGIVMDKLDLLIRLKASRVSDVEIVRNMDLVRITNKDILKVSSQDYQKLEIVKDFLSSYGNFDKMSNKYRYHYNLLCVLYDLNYLKYLVNEETLHKLTDYLNVNAKIGDLSISERISMVENMVRKYYMANGNIVKMIENGENEASVLRLLSDDLLSFVLKNNEDREQVLRSLSDYSSKECVIKFLKKKKNEGFKY